MGGKVPELGVGLVLFHYFGGEEKEDPYAGERLVGFELVRSFVLLLLTMIIHMYGLI